MCSCSMINKMPGDDWQKFANLRTAYGFMFGHPGKKLLFMGQDFAQYDEWNANKELDWYLIDRIDNNRMLQQYFKKLLSIYRKYPALYEQDFTYDGFEWMNCNDWSHSEVSFVRKPSTPGEKFLLFVCNFVPVPHDNFMIGVPCKGEYNLILNSDSSEYGGSDYNKTKTLVSEKREADGKPYSVIYSIPPLSVSIFEFDYVEDEPEPPADPEAEKKRNKNAEKLQAMKKKQADKKQKAAKKAEEEKNTVKEEPEKAPEKPAEEKKEEPEKSEAPAAEEKTE